jgi:hypothetical protein
MYGTDIQDYTVKHAQKGAHTVYVGFDLHHQNSLNIRG